VTVKHRPTSAPTHDAPELDDEDRRDLTDGLAALLEFRESDEPAVELGELKKRLGLR
jgi:hypothetical protein